MFRSIIDDLNEKTLGRLLKNIKSTGKFDDKILLVIDEALERRNYLQLPHNPTTSTVSRKMIYRSGVTKDIDQRGSSATRKLRSTR